MACQKPVPPVQVVLPTQLAEQCQKVASPPNIQKVGDRIYVARGFDLANVMIVKTKSGGSVVIDSSSNLVAARQIQQALIDELKVPKLDIDAIILTHSHIDHTGGVSMFQQKGTDIWATSSFKSEFLKQYGFFQPLEKLRANFQFGLNVDASLLPCSSIGPRLNLENLAQNGTLMPNKTFESKEEITIGGDQFVLYAAPGETMDQLMIWMPEIKAVFIGDNYYNTFPNLYTIRGTSARPIDKWIESIDLARSLEPEFLIPSHTEVVVGKAEIQKQLTAYRDAIQWVHDQTIRRVNMGENINSVAANLKLPSATNISQLYGQVDWSAKAVYSNNLGWFDGAAESLAADDFKDLAIAEVNAMGGPDAVIKMAKESVVLKPKWALHLIEKIFHADFPISDAVKQIKYDALYNIAMSTENTNARAYLLESALQLNEEGKKITPPVISDKLLNTIPIEVFFKIMVTKLDGEKSADTLATIAFQFDDLKTTIFLTLRNGIAELQFDHLLASNPKPIGTIRTKSMAWKKLALKRVSKLGSFLTGSVRVDGDRLQVIKLLSYFQ